MTQTTQATPLFLAWRVFGFSVGNMVTFPALIVQREFEPASFGLLIALSTAIGQVTYALGPASSAFIRGRDWRLFDGADAVRGVGSDLSRSVPLTGRCSQHDPRCG